MFQNNLNKCDCKLNYKNFPIKGDWMQSVLSDLLLPSFPVDLFVNAIFIMKYVCVMIAMIMNAPFSFQLFISMQKGKPIIIPNYSKQLQQKSSNLCKFPKLFKSAKNKKKLNFIYSAMALHVLMILLISNQFFGL